MPFWPFYMAACAGLTLWGWRSGAWVGPALALAGFVGMRLIVWYVPLEWGAWREVIGGTWWIAIGGLMIVSGWSVAGFFATASGLTYPIFAMLGARIVYLGILPIVADLLIILCMLSIAGGLAGIATLRPDSLGRPDRSVHGRILSKDSVARR